MNSRGNIIVIFSVVLLGILAIAGFSVDTVMFFLKREQVRTLSEQIATSAVLSLPHKKETLRAAESWYQLLNHNQTKAKNQLSLAAIENKADQNNPYVIDGLKVRISDLYLPKFLPTLGTGLKVVGETSAHLRPTDVVIVLENTASLSKGQVRNYLPFTRVFGEQRGKRYAAQCYNDVSYHFRKGAVELYDQLSQIGHFRVGVVLSTSKSHGPLILSQLGENVLKPNQLEFDKDQPDNHSTRCALLTRKKDFPVPLNPNHEDGVWQARQDLSSLLRGRTRAKLSLKASAKLLVREALWVVPFGSATDSGFISPRYYYERHEAGLQLAAKMLAGSRRDDGLAVKTRYVILLTDDAGALPPQFGGKSRPSFCKNWKVKNTRLLVAYLGHSNTLYGHGYNPVSPFGKRVAALKRDCQSAGIFFLETSPQKKLHIHDFWQKSMPLLAHSLKQAEVAS